MYLSKFAKEYLTVPVNDPDSNIMKIQMPAWISESHCFQQNEVDVPMTCFWCGAECKEPLTMQTVSLCPKNPYLQKIFEIENNRIKRRIKK